MHDLGFRIVRAMHEESQDHGAAFLLVTQVPNLHETATRNGLVSLDVREPMSNAAFRLSDDLQHINEAGNGVLAWQIARTLRADARLSYAGRLEN